MSNIPPIESQPESAKRPAKIHYHIATPHGLIERKSDREYTHAVYNVQWVDDKPRIYSVSFCGNERLARSNAMGRTGEYYIVQATVKGSK